MLFRKKKKQTQCDILEIFRHFTIVILSDIEILLKILKSDKYYVKHLNEINIVEDYRCVTVRNQYQVIAFQEEKKTTNTV